MGVEYIPRCKKNHFETQQTAAQKMSAFAKVFVSKSKPELDSME
jgi:hypothetical protein